jgi:hypothetical protein
VPIYLINFEEMRAPTSDVRRCISSSLVALLLRERSTIRGRAPRCDRVAFALQPIVAARAAGAWREALLARLTERGVLNPEDTLRTLYARQYLGVASEGPRFYYSARGLLEWLDRNARPGDRVLTDRNEIGLAGLPVVGAFQTVANYSVTNDAAAGRKSTPSAGARVARHRRGAQAGEEVERRS